MKRPDSLRDYRWQVAKNLIAQPSQGYPETGGMHPVLRQILANRGLHDPADVQAFLENRYTKSRDPFLLTDMDKAVARIRHALEEGQQIAVYGDYDADGVTSTVLLTEALRGLADDRRQVRPYIPDRVDEGYGLNSEALTNLRDLGVDLVVSVDCGIRSPVEVAHAKNIGLDIIVTDHHGIGRTIPTATAVINPKRPGSTYPEKMLAGVGIAYKLAQALCQEMPDRVRFDESDLLDLVALGTVADLAPLTGENRKLVAEGLEVLNQVRRPGVAALMNVSGVAPGEITAETIGFTLGPRINAAGRLAHAYDAAKLLATQNARTAQELAHSLDALNRRRQQLTTQLSEQAAHLVEPDAPIIIAGDAEFNSGIVGLVASRLAEQTYRPVIIMEYGETESRGSCRSIPEFHITEALDTVYDLLERHGGHAQAAGFTIKNENIPEFTERMTALATDALTGQDLRPALEIDAELPVADVDWALQETLQQLEPTGMDNSTPRFMAQNVPVLSQRAVGRDSAHLQLVLGTINGQGTGEHRPPLPAIAFRQGAWAGQLPDRIDLVYGINVNRWQGRSSLQLMVEDIRPSGENDNSD